MKYVWLQLALCWCFMWRFKQHTCFSGGWFATLPTFQLPLHSKWHSLSPYFTHILFCKSTSWSCKGRFLCLVLVLEHNHTHRINIFLFAGGHSPLIWTVFLDLLRVTQVSTICHNFWYVAKTLSGILESFNWFPASSSVPKPDNLRMANKPPRGMQLVCSSQIFVPLGVTINIFVYNIYIYI